MLAIGRRIGRVWARVRDTRYRGSMRRRAVEEQRYQDRVARHEAGIYESPRGDGGFGG